MLFFLDYMEMFEMISSIGNADAEVI